MNMRLKIEKNTKNNEYSFSCSKSLGHLKQHVFFYLFSSSLCMCICFIPSNWLSMPLSKQGREKIAAQNPHVPMVQFQIHRETHSLTNQCLIMFGSDFLPTCNLLLQEVQSHCMKMVARKLFPWTQEKAKDIIVRWKDIPKYIYFIYPNKPKLIREHSLSW